MFIHFNWYFWIVQYKVVKIPKTMDKPVFKVISVNINKGVSNFQPIYNACFKSKNT